MKPVDQIRTKTTGAPRVAHRDFTTAGYGTSATFNAMTDCDSESATGQSGDLMAVLAIDQGTSGTKAIVVDESGAVLATADADVRPDYLVGGGVEVDPVQLLNSVLETGRQAIAQAGRPIDAVALANQGETVLAWNRQTGAPLSKAIVWQDSRSADICSELGDCADLIATRTGLVLDPYFSAPKMAWLRRHVTSEGVVTTSDTWLLHQLTGEFVTDVTTASRSLVLDLDTAQWSGELLDLFGLADEPLPRIVDCDEVIGTTEAFGSPMAVGGLVVDQQAALLAEACLTAGSAKCTYGTGAFLLANAGHNAVRSTGRLTTSVAWRVRGELSYCIDAQVYTAASAFRWLSDIGVLSNAGAIDDVAAADSAGVFFSPGLAGLGSPWWHAEPCGALVGMSLSTERGHIVQAVVEGIAAQVAELVAVVEADLGIAVPTLRVDGGLTRSHRLLQAQADLLQRPIEVYPSANATAEGAAALARLASDPKLCVGDAVGGAALSVVVEPRWSADRAAEFLGLWRATVQATKDIS